jgi:hypothetical protein
MQVEVNAQNIIIYGLVQLTGNSAEEMLKHAAEAAEAGYILTCRIPDVEETIDMNVFEAAGGEPSKPLEHKDHPMMGEVPKPRETGEN